MRTLEKRIEHIESLVERDHAMIEEIHAEYVKAGCDVLETNTFGANRINLARYALADKVREINIAGARPFRRRIRRRTGHWCSTGRRQRRRSPSQWSF